MFYSQTSLTQSTKRIKRLSVAKTPWPPKGNQHSTVTSPLKVNNKNGNTMESEGIKTGLEKSLHHVM